MLRPDLSLPIPATITKAHFVGIGGSGMSGIAQMFLNSGVAVSGSDRSDSDTLQALAAAGASTFVGHDAANLSQDVDALVHTTAIWPENPEYLLAKERRVPIIHRSQALHWLTKNKRVIAVAGAHGKTTSTGMIVTALKQLGDDPNFVNGGVIAGLGVSSGSGTGNDFVIEADESDGSFLIYDTAVALITNVDPDHLDHYGSREAFEDAFVKFADEASEAVVISSDDPGAVAVLQRLSHPNILTFGQAADATVRVSNIAAGGENGNADLTFTVTHDGESVDVAMAVAGVHNAINATGAIAVLRSLGYGLAESAKAVSGFAGTVRRFELHGEERGVRVYDDYAHHPTEVRAALEAARTVIGEGRIIALHQPHTYSRTQHLAREFAEVLEDTADHTVVLDVYGAREDPVPGVTGELVSSAFADQSKVTYEPDWQRAAEAAAQLAREGDYIITLGCGNVYLIIPQVLEALQGAALAHES